MNSSFIVDEGMQYRPTIPIAPTTTLIIHEAVAVSGTQLKKATSALFASVGNHKFLGIAITTAENPAASAQLASPPVVVKQGFTWECELDLADPPTSAELFSDVALSTEKSVKKTIVGTDIKFKLLELRPGNRALVWVPNPA